MTLLERLVTNDTTNWTSGETRYGALLTPQGKVIADYLAIRTDEGVLFDVSADYIDDLAKRLKMFRLRSDVQIEKREDLFIVAGLEDALAGVRPISGALQVFLDHRYAGGRLRGLATRESWGAWYGYHPAEWSVPLDAYHTDRISNGIPEQGSDYGAAEVFPADINMDVYKGVALNKGCFVGQEVVSRMHRRGKIRKRTLPLSALDNLPVGADIVGETPIGKITSAEGTHALALIRIDRMAAAETTSAAFTVNETPVTLQKPDWLKREMTAQIVHG